MTLQHRTVSVGSLSREAVSDMFALFERVYEHTERARFEADLREKHDVVLLEERGRLAGFSTLQVLTSFERGLVVYSGDTVIDPAFWGQKTLQVAFLEYILRLQVRHPLRRVYWLLTTKGYKTYLLLANYFPKAWPRVDAPTPPDVRAFMDRLGREKYGDSYDAAQGVVRLGDVRDRVREGVADPRPVDLHNPHIRFFTEVNPTWRSGDELLCLAHIRRRDPPYSLARLALRRLRR